jgi:hypothetical protein
MTLITSPFFTVPKRAERIPFSLSIAGPKTLLLPIPTSQRFHSEVLKFYFTSAIGRAIVNKRAVVDYFKPSRADRKRLADECHHQICRFPNSDTLQCADKLLTGFFYRLVVGGA